VQQTLARLGPDALAVSRREFDDLLSRSRRTLKALLIDQTALAGLGNLLADEILWRAGIDPRHPASELTPEQRARLYDQMRRVLRASVGARRVPPRRSWLTGVRDDPDARCPRCGTPLRRHRVGGRTTVWCPQCQPETQ
jgi:formamidopyrimidine-DNA glycosylase